MTGEFAIAVHALVFLNHKKTILSSDALAENVCTNPARIRKVMAKLKKSGLVETKEGMEGGYHFGKDPRTVTLRQVGEAVEADYVSTGWRPGNGDMDCLVASGMAGVMDGIYEDLNALCEKRLESTTILDIARKIFGEASGV